MKSAKWANAVGMCSLILLFSCFSRSAFGQAEAYNSSLSGVVTDSSNAAVPGARVRLTAPEKGISREYETGKDGRYVFTLLPPGTYELRVEHEGFRPIVQDNIVLSVGQAANLDLSLQVGSTSEEVTVTASGPLLNTANANIASTVSAHETVELPLNLRNAYGLVSLNSAVNNSLQFQNLNAPGTQGTADQDISFFNFGGAYMGTTAFLLDGTWDIAADWGGTIYVPSVENVQEFKIQSNAFTAEYGWASGNVVNVITKSGSSSLHGDVFEFLRNSALDANNFFNNSAGIPNPAVRRNQFGIAAGGPLYIPKLYKQTTKTFFFANYEGLRQSTPVTLVTTMPTSAMRNGDFSALLGGQVGTDCLGRGINRGQIYNPFTTRAIRAGQRDSLTGATATCSGYIRDPFVGNVIPSSAIDRVAKNLLQYWPAANGAGLVNNYTASAGAPVTADEYSVRVDHNLSDASRLFFRWSQKFESKQLAGNLYGNDNPGGPGVIAPNNRWDAVANFSRVFSPSTVMSINLGLGRWTEGNAVQGYPFLPSSLGLPSFIDANSNQFPNITISGMASLGPSQSAGAGQGTFPRNAGSYSVDVTKVVGAHTMNIGFMGVVAQTLGGRIAPTSFTFPLSMTQGPDPNQGVATTGFGFASFLLGTGDSTGSTGIAALPAASKNQLGWYLQDDWKVSRTLTLNLGIRYELQTAPTERFDRQSWFDFTASNPISKAVGFNVPGQLVFTGGANRRGLFDEQLTNIAPRVGLAYKLTNKLVMRSGYGIFYLPAFRGSGTLAGFSQTTPFVGTVDGITPQNVLSNPFPGGLILPPGKTLGGLTNVGLTTSASDNYRPTPYMNQWMFGLQYELSPNNLLDVTYVGNHGVKLAYGTIQRDQLSPQNLALGNALLAPVQNPFYGAISTSACGLSSPTVPYGQLLRPFPQFCGVNDAQVIGASSSYNALELSYTHRWSDGLHLLVSYTASKFLDNTAGTAGFVSSANTYRNFYDLSAEKSLDADDIPQSLVVSYVYELPFGRGKKLETKLSKPVNAVIGGWQVSGITTAKAGFPLSISAATNNTNSLGGNQRPNIIADPHLGHPTLTSWFNKAAFAQPAPFTFGNTPRTMPNLRSPGLQNWDLAIQKWWGTENKLRVQFRAEMYNAFNHVNFYAPNTTFGDPRFGIISGALPSRQIQMGLKVYW